MNKKDIKRSIFSYVFALAVLICLYYAFVSFRNVNNQLSYDEFMSNLNKGTIEKLGIVYFKCTIVRKSYKWYFKCKWKW